MKDLYVDGFCTEHGVPGERVSINGVTYIALKNEDRGEICSLCDLTHGGAICMKLPGCTKNNIIWKEEPNE